MRCRWRSLREVTGRICDGYAVAGTGEAMIAIARLGSCDE